MGIHTTVGRWNGLADEDIESLIYLKKEHFDYKDWVALKYAQEWTLRKGLSEPQGDYVTDYKYLYTEKERKSIDKMLRLMRWANFTSHFFFRTDFGKWRLDLQGYSPFLPYDKQLEKENECPCMCLREE